MIDEKALETIVREVLANLTSGKVAQSQQETGSSSAMKLDPKKDYPLGKKRPELAKSVTGKTINEITLQAVMEGKITPDDLKISAETLLAQAEIAEAVGRKQLANNFRRAAELTKVPDQRILEIYNALRPYRSTKEELLAIADELENVYGAKICAAFVREAAEVYERRRRLKGME
ncbi:MAG: Dehydratase, small subunit [Caldanaerobacter subterraneus]|uniref:Propanediol dehydratase small subunit PduE n=1 Tax=Caldanaerobacter subterraneus TaxID=911092 RepID=A0A101E504_9THEO|nr:diol dehydratase small subunit [Caldanaerobacter subterraneus]KUK08686.1 MAG: Dehydratase, small subunit [Caldanaerobacter subterraneus]HBT49842.1 propanediol dehydratase small subunit PduE [Caldanaerobacter subterraneus]